MSTPFLLNFVAALLPALEARGLLEVRAGRQRQVVDHVAAHLAVSRSGEALIDRLVAGFVSAPDVEELFVDDRTLHELIIDLGLTH